MTNHSKEVGAFGKVSGLNLWLKKSCLCWSWNTGQETLDVLNSIIYVAINKNTSITVIPWVGKQYYDPHKHTGQVSASLAQLHFTSTYAECTAWGKIFSLLLEQPRHIGDWCQRTKKIHLEITTPVFVFFFVLLPHRFCLPKLYEWGLVRPVSKTWYCLWLQCQWHNKWGKSKSVSVCDHRSAALGPWGRNMLRRNWMMLWFSSGGVIVTGVFQFKWFLQMIRMGSSG